MWNLKNEINIKLKQTHRCRELPEGKEFGRLGGKGEEEIKKYKLGPWTATSVG